MERISIDSSLQSCLITFCKSAFGYDGETLQLVQKKYNIIDKILTKDFISCTDSSKSKSNGQILQKVKVTESEKKYKPAFVQINQYSNMKLKTVRIFLCLPVGNQYCLDLK